jgi:hypothetical protein
MAFIDYPIQSMLSCIRLVERSPASRVLCKLLEPPTRLVSFSFYVLQTSPDFHLHQFFLYGLA